MSSFMISQAVTNKGWLSGRDKNFKTVDYPTFLKVTNINKAGERTYFSVQEGSYKGQKGSVFTVVDGKPSLVDASHDSEGLVFVEFDTSKVEQVADADGNNWPMYVGKLWLGYNPEKSPKGIIGHVLKAFSIRVLTWRDDPAPTNWTAIRIPDFPHGKGGPYMTESMYAKTWFPIGDPKDERYLHAGQISGGCLTVDPKGWTRVYEYLIRRRKDSFNVGAVHVGGL